MARPKSPCGTEGAYRRHKRAHERIDDKCQAWKDGERRDVAPQKPKSAKKAAADAKKERPLTLGELDFVAETLNSLNLVRAALVVAQPSQIASLTKRKSELMRELKEYQEEADGISSDRRPEVDPFEALLGGTDLSNVTRFDAHTAAAG